MAEPGRDERPWDQQPDQTSRKADASLVGCFWILGLLGAAFIVVMLVVLL